MKIHYQTMKQMGTSMPMDCQTLRLHVFYLLMNMKQLVYLVKQVHANYYDQVQLLPTLSHCIFIQNRFRWKLQHLLQIYERLKHQCYFLLKYLSYKDLHDVFHAASNDQWLP